ncbi:MULTISPECIES: hypothetical protein [unclassified Kitasatospora]|uniref:hypothetical protein n=1 Tax=unclassified Kitasatospora TaxID=2633591 RepID=UPI0033F3EFBC
MPRTEPRTCGATRARPPDGTPRRRRAPKREALYRTTAPAGYSPGGRSTGGLVCLRNAYNDRATSPYGDCAGVRSPTDTSPSGMYGEHNLPNGARLFLVQPAANVAGATMTFGNAAPTTVATATVPGTAFTGYAIPVPAASHMNTLDEYDTQHRTVGHQNL